MDEDAEPRSVLTADSLDRLRLVAVHDCAVCDGGGSIESDDWAGYREWADRNRVPKDERFERAMDYFGDVLGEVVVPPMNRDCEACEGSGTVRVEIPVREVLDLVLAEIDRPVVSGPEITQWVNDIKKAITAAASRSQGLLDGGAGEALRDVQEGAQALQSLGELRARPRDHQ